MPKSTFLNLRPEKRADFTDAALYEFALNDYQNASITNMVKVLGIAKGSVYQYFENKKDLYEFLIELAAEEKLKYTKKVIKKAGDGDFMKWYRKLLHQSLLFDLENPMLGCLLINVSQERNNAEIGNLALTNKRETAIFLQKVLELHQPKTLPASLRTNKLAFHLTQLGFGLTDAFCIEKELDLREFAQERTPVEYDEEEVKAFVKDMVNALKPSFE